MKRIFTVLLGVLVGIGVGWLLGYVMPSAKRQRELLEQYHYVRDGFHMSDKEMAEAGPQIPQYFENMKRQDEMAARLSLSGYVRLEHGKIEDTKRHLLMAVGSYYRLYHGNGGDTNFIAAIEKVARQYPAVAAEITRTD